MYPWISEGSIRKYHRALKELTSTNQPVTEEAVKALYVKWGGLVAEVKAEAKEEVKAEPKVDFRKVAKK